MGAQFDKLKTKLSELFELDKADLDFGIYRVLRQRHQEISDFLENKLTTVVQNTLTEFTASDTASLKEELETAIEGAKSLGVDPDSVEKVKELRARLDKAPDSSEIEEEIYSHLLTFFSRYYEGGDFISQRRYKGGDSYAIPYDGEEVKLVWANMDQYYIKSSELLRDYTFRWKPMGEAAEGELALEAGEEEEVVVRFKLVEGDTEKDNRKSSGKTTRAFALDADEPYSVVGQTLLIRFTYREHPFKTNLQDHLNKDIVKTLADALPEDWRKRLFAKAPSEKNPNRTVLEKHLRGYTAKFQFDYFIHKDLGGFLRRELDFYLKNEVMHLDDIESETASRAEEFLNHLRAVRRVATPVIEMLEQLEDFQKKLWLKKKFVVETRYVMTLDRVPEELFDGIVECDAQWEEWDELVALSETEGFEKSSAFLRSQPHLAVDTRILGGDLSRALIASCEDLSEQIEGECFHADNFHALASMESKYRNQIKCIYLDPPYNTDVSSIPYKNDLKHSSWATMMRDRLTYCASTLAKDGAAFVSIDKHERTSLEFGMNQAFGSQNSVEELIWSQNTNDGRSPTYSTNHEYVLVYSKDIAAVESDIRMFREPKPGYLEVSELIAKLEKKYPAVDEVEKAIAKLYSEHKAEYKAEVLAKELDWNTEKKNDPWKGLFNYKHVEYRDKAGKYVEESEAQDSRADIWVFRESDWTIMESDQKQSSTTKDPDHSNFRYYIPTHPETGKPCTPSSRGWKGTQFIDPEHPERNSFESLLADHRIAFGKDENKVPQQKRFLHEVDTNVCKSIFVDYSDGEKETYALFGKKGVFLAPKHTNFVKRFLLQSTNEGDVAMDCFGGTGSTADAVLSLNKTDGGGRRYITAEMGLHFDGIIIPRLKKSVYSSLWNKGKPVERNTGISHAFKIIRLESYEDCMNNLSLERSDAQSRQLDQHPEVKDDYMLRYFLDVESQDSLLNTQIFQRPFDYQLDIATSSAGETVPTPVDLVETFNWLLGLKVKHMDFPKGFVTVTGTDREEKEQILIIWRNLDGDDAKDHEALTKFLERQQINPSDTEYDAIYLNGPHTLDDPFNKIRLTEEHFHRLMFEGTE
jgi:adenine-specific DNA-methyltransferase